MKRMLVSSTPVTAAHRGSGRVSISLEQFYVNTDWTSIAQQFPRDTTIIVQILREQHVSVQHMRQVAQILAAYGHQLLIDEEGEPLREAGSV